LNKILILSIVLVNALYILSILVNNTKIDLTSSNAINVLIKYVTDSSLISELNKREQCTPSIII